MVRTEQPFTPNEDDWFNEDVDADVWCVCWLDDYGDAYDVDTYDNHADALTEYDRATGYLSLVLERRNYTKHHDTWNVIAHKGDDIPLTNGGWTE